MVEYKFSNRMNTVKASAVREILKMMKDPNIISFGGGNPASETLPVETLKQISDQLFDKEASGILSYGITEGDPKMKETALAFFSRKESLCKEYDEVMITSGSQQIMDFMAKALCNEGDVVVCENPSFLGALNSFKSNGAKLVGIDMEEDGIDLVQLEKALSAKPTPKFMYLIPNFQNPTGITMSIEKRKAVYQLALKYQVPILEDNPYGDLRFQGNSVASIKSLDQEGLVIYAASLSKIIAPGMRVAMMIGHKDLLNKITICKQVNDVHTNAWAQKVMMEFLKQTDMETYLSSLQQIYKEKCELMLTKMEETFDRRVTWTKPEGGMFIWVTFPDEIDVDTFVKNAIARNVAVVPGNAFYYDDSLPCHCVRLNFSMPTKQQIIDGIQILGDLTKEMLAND